MRFVYRARSNNNGDVRHVRFAADRGNGSRPNATATIVGGTRVPAETNSSDCFAAASHIIVGRYVASGRDTDLHVTGTSDRVD